MSSPFKVMLGVIMFVVLIFSTMGILSSSQNSSAAASYLNVVTSEISNSNLNDTVINELKNEALANGYVLTVEKVGEDEFGDAIYAVCELEYKYQIPVLKIDKRYKISSVAK